MTSVTLSTVSVTKKDGIAHVELNRPKQGNAMNTAFWKEFREVFQEIAEDTTVRCVVLSGQGKFFTVGLDIKDTQLLGSNGPDSARTAWQLRKTIVQLQESFNVIEKCPQPVIVCSHNACIGGGIDLMCACDIRYSTNDAWFSVKEVDIGLAADVGTLQRIQHVTGNASLVRELAYTARVFPTKDEMLAEAFAVAKQIASKSPVAIAGTKHNLLYSRGRTVADSLEYMATWNAAFLQTDDVAAAAVASLKKGEQPEFSKL